MGFFDKFKSKPTETAPAKPVIAENHVSQKKKNTYQIRFSHFCDLTLFELCRNTPMGVATLNGKPTCQTNDWIHCTEFPNPCACDMAKKKDVLREIMGPKISTQIIEYLDKETGEPVIQVYPHMLHVFDKYEENYMERLNHASRRDLSKQIALREKLISDFMARQK